MGANIPGTPVPHLVRRGGRIGREFVRLAGAARYGFVADPDGKLDRTVRT